VQVVLGQHPPQEAPVELVEPALEPPVVGVVVDEQRREIAAQAAQRAREHVHALLDPEHVGPETRGAIGDLAVEREHSGREQRAIGERVDPLRLALHVLHVIDRLDREAELDERVTARARREVGRQLPDEQDPETLQGCAPR
jgi:hypothetical protein